MITETPIAGIPARRLNRALRRSHERQFFGVDWQTAAVDGWHDLGTQSEEVFNFLCTAPCQGCECGFCAGAPWED